MFLIFYESRFHATKNLTAVVRFNLKKNICLHFILYFSYFPHVSYAIKLKEYLNFEIKEKSKSKSIHLDSLEQGDLI